MYFLISKSGPEDMRFQISNLYWGMKDEEFRAQNAQNPVSMP